MANHVVNRFHTHTKASDVATHVQEFSYAIVEGAISEDVPIVYAEMPRGSMLFCDANDSFRTFVDDLDSSGQ